MIKQRYKPLYKQFKRLRKNVQNRKKFFNLKKKKWSNLINKPKNNNQKRFLNVYDFSLFKKTRYGFFFQNKYKLELYEKFKIRLFYGLLKKKYFVNVIKNCKSLDFIFFLEKRLDVILYRSFFVQSIREAKQLILHGSIYVNKNKVKLSSYSVKKGDIIEISKHKLLYIKSNLKILLLDQNINFNNKKLVPNYLNVNFNLLKIIIISKIDYRDIIVNFNFFINFNNLKLI